MRGRCSRVRAKEEFVGLGIGPGRAVPDRTKAAVLVDSGDAFIVVTWRRERLGWVREVKRVL